MPQSLSLVLIHVVFSTKDRRPVLTPTLRLALHAYPAVVSPSPGALDLARTRTVAGLVETRPSALSPLPSTHSSTPHSGPAPREALLLSWCLPPRQGALT